MQRQIGPMHGYPHCCLSALPSEGHRRAQPGVALSRRELLETIRVIDRGHVVVRRCATVPGVTAEAVTPNLAVT